MRAWWQAAISLALLAGASAAQNAPSPAAPAQNIPAVKSVPANSSNLEVVAELTKSVNARKAQAGDEVKAAVTQDVIVHGRIVIRRGSKLIGHITEVKARSKSDQESHVGVIFDRAVLKGGQELGLRGTVQAIAAPPANTINDSDMLPPPFTLRRQQTGGPQRVDDPTAGSTRGTGLPSTEKPMDTVNPTGTSDPGVGVPFGLAAKNHAGNLMGSGSRGVFGLPGLQLKLEAAGETVISSVTRNVSLESGTQILVQASIPRNND